MSMILLRHGDRLLAIGEFALGWGGHSDRSRLRAEDLRVTRAALDRLLRGEDLGRALGQVWVLVAERVALLEAAVADGGTLVDVSEWTPIHWRGIGHWEVRAGLVRRVSGRGAPGDPYATADVPAVAEAVAAETMLGVFSRLGAWLSKESQASGGGLPSGRLAAGARELEHLWTRCVLGESPEVLAELCGEGAVP